MKKLCFALLFGLFLGVGFTTTAQMPEVLDVDALPKDNRLTPDSSQLFQEDPESHGSLWGEKVKLRDYTGKVDEKNGGNQVKGTGQLRNIVLRATDFIKKILIPVAVLFVAFSGISLYFSQGDEEEFTKKKSQILGMGMGFGLFSLAVNAVDWVFFGREGEILRGGDVSEFALRGVMELEGIFDYLSTFVVIVATAFIVYNAFTLIIAGGEDESQIANVKKRIIYSAIGIVLIIVTKPLIDIFSKGGELAIPDGRSVISFLMQWANFLLGLIGVFAVIALVYGGVRLVANFGDEEATSEAKNIIKAAVIGIVLAFSAFTIIYYVSSAGGA